MEAASRPVTSNQPGLHPRLATTIARHRQHAWRKPAQKADEQGLACLEGALAAHEGPIILDSFCGTGMSTAILARRHPEALVIGIDQSEQRLRRAEPDRDNQLLLHAHCEAIWRYLAEHDVTLAAHFLLYPNPWPKAAHLSRRVHGHPAFPTLLKLGGKLELRSNWQVYVEEFGVALHLMGTPARIATVGDTEESMSLFERKYRASGHDLWRLTAEL